VVALLAWLAELVVVRRGQIFPGTRGFLVGGLILPIIVMGLVTGGGIVFAYRSFGHVVMAGSGMSPTIEKGDDLHYSKRIDWNRVKRGSLIVFKNSPNSRWGEAGWIVVSRILAMPGDSISIKGGHYVVNGEQAGLIATTGKFDLAIDIPTAPQATIVPEGCYFMVQDNSTNSFDSRVLSWARKEDLLSARVWRFNKERFFQPVE
jgi:signal peptidase I